MKITNRDNGAAEMPLVKQERAIFRGAWGASHSLHLPGSVEQSLFTTHRAGLGFSLSVIQGGRGTPDELQCLSKLMGRGDCRDTQAHVAHHSQLYHL